jgi:hypothetical protein
MVMSATYQKAKASEELVGPRLPIEIAGLIAVSPLAHGTFVCRKV